MDYEPAEAYSYSNGFVDRDGFQCIRCGCCCTEMSGGYCFSVDDEQIEFWAKNKPNLLNWIRFNEGWVSPHTGEDVCSCPWYRNYRHPRFKMQGPACLIQQYKPQVCSNFPLSVLHAVKCYCRGFVHLPKDDLIKRIQNEIDIDLINLKSAKWPSLRGMIKRKIEKGIQVKQRVLNGEYTLEWTRS